ncbi:hypothetical protein C1H46_032570 [Malus baccata]|uniref:YbaK/aminoacyl-tRNA synthetase-associated domain-containing protein n=1 Tax=Malus baccata TaxID=106549 RepID=A0A540L5W6_MALBA|nr:hypothetical protein C1H46_032570 [Malus baccata]
MLSDVEADAFEADDFGTIIHPSEEREVGVGKRIVDLLVGAGPSAEVGVGKRIVDLLYCLCLCKTCTEALMGLSKEQLLARLKELQVDFPQHEHPVVLTVEAQAKDVGNLGGGLSENLFLKDKKRRFYTVSALAGTKVDLKGPSGLRYAFFPGE